MIQAELGLANENQIAQRTALLQAQEQRVRELYPTEKALKESQANYEIARAKKLEEFSAFEKRKILEQIEGEKALRTSRLSNAALDDERRRQAALIGPSEIKRVEEQIALDKARREDIGETRKQKAKEYEETHVDFIFPDGSQRKIPANEIRKALDSGGEPTAHQKFTEEDTLKQRARQTAQDTQKAKDDVLKAEKDILYEDNKGRSIDNPAVLTKIEKFNSESTGSYFYEPRTGKAVKIGLVDANGKPLQAKAVYAAWLKFQEAKGPISLKDYVKQYTGRNK